jgi:hypothetical protein
MDNEFRGYVNNMGDSDRHNSRLVWELEAPLYVRLWFFDSIPVNDYKDIPIYQT